MLEYLLNTTLIWLIGLLLFDIFLRREAFHNYNRVYLLTVLISGILIPLWSWDSNGIVYSSGITEPLVSQTNQLKEGVSEAGTQLLLSWGDWLWLIYIGGAAIMVGKLIFEVVQIIKLINTGTKRTVGGKPVINIKKAISPFSLFGNVFIYNADSYEAQELKMILAHEEEHGKLLHTVDLLIIKLVQTMFWFHPLTYIIEKRLRMVHEYQADLTGKNNTTTYGKFLIEQSVLGAAPALSHSFIRSPLKKRILMLTRKTNRIAKSKQLFILPFVFITMVCCTQTAFSDDAPQKDGNIVTYRGNAIEFTDPGPNDTVWIENPVTGELTIEVVIVDPRPLKLNGEKIYEGELSFQNDNGIYTDNSSLYPQDLKRYLLKGLENELKVLGNGKYAFAVTNIIVDKKGKVVYFEYSPIAALVWNHKKADINNEAAKAIEQKISELMNNLPKQTPAQYKGKNVNSVAPMYHEKFVIRNGKIET